MPTESASPVTPIRRDRSESPSWHVRQCPACHTQVSQPTLEYAHQYAISLKAKWFFNGFVTAGAIAFSFLCIGFLALRAFA